MNTGSNPVPLHTKTSIVDEADAAEANGATRLLAHYAATFSYSTMPPALVELTKRSILDTLGVCIGASTLAPEAKIVAEYVKDLAGKGESTILGFGGKAPAPWATFVNGSLGHMLDYDGVSASGGGHVGIATVPIAFAFAEKSRGISGRDLIAAIAIGGDVFTRLYRSIGVPDWTMSEGWFPTQLLGYIAGAATAGRLLGLDEAQMENAFGIAFNQACGSRQMAVGAATHLRAMQAGFSGQGAALAAQLAQRGIIGSKEILEGRYGLYKTYVRIDRPNWDAIVGGHGTRFALLQTHGFKVWPACGFTRVTNTATQQLRQEFNLQPDDIEAITVIGGTGGTKLLSLPLEAKRRPRSSIDGKYSIPFTTAVMMVKGNVTLHDYTEQGLRDPAVLAMADRVGYRDAPPDAPPEEDHSLSRPTVEVRTKDGRVYTRRPAGVPGDPNNPVSASLLESKFRDCLSFSAKPVPGRNIDRVIDMLNDLENAADATEVIRLLS